MLKRSYQVLLGNLSAFFFITLGATSPLYIVYAWLGYDLGLEPPAGAIETILHVLIVSALAGSLASVLTTVATGFIVFGTLRELQGQPASLGEIMQHGLSTLAPLLGAAVLLAAIFFLGFALAVIPALVCSVLFWATVPVLVVERRGVIASLRRSCELTKGSRWPIFGLALLALAASAAFGAACGAFLDYETDYLRSFILEWGFTILLDAFFAVMAAITYFDLKRIKEGADVDQIAAVFD